VREKVAAIAAQRGMRVENRAPARALDLLDIADTASACRDWLSAGRTRS
jgi:hypothetical protein